MTDVRLTQEAVEQWGSGTPQAQATQISIEHWASVITTAVQASMTTIAIEQWASVIPVAGGGAQARVMVMA